MEVQNKTRDASKDPKHAVVCVIGCIALFALGACVQIAGITKPTLLDENTGGAGGDGGNVNSGGSGSGAASSSSGNASTTSSSSSASSSGGGMPCNNSGDCPNDTECENWYCMMGMCGSAFDVAGSVCTGGICNGNGICVECVVDAYCTTGTSPSCFQENCISCSDGVKNGDETGVDCGGSKCKKCLGSSCNQGNDCISTFCADDVCCDNACTGTCKFCNLPANVGTCTNIPLGTIDDDAPICGGTEVCNGAGACKLKNGEPCNNNLDCASNNCTGIPKICQP